MREKVESLLAYLKNHTSWHSRKELADFLNVSTRQVTNYIKEINLDSEIIISSSKGYRLQPSLIGKNINMFNESSIDARNRQILLALCDAKTGIDYYDLAETLFISISLLENTISSLKPLFKDFNLLLSKRKNLYILKGEERDIRHFETIHIYRNNLNAFNQIHGSFITITQIKSILKDNEIFINDFSLQLFTLNINIMFKRNQNGFYTTMFLSNENIPKQYDNAIKNIINTIQVQSNLTIDKNEYYWIKELLISSSSLYNPMDINKENLNNYVEQEYIDISNKILKEVQLHFPIITFDDNFKVRFTIHIRNCFLQKNIESYNIDNLTEKIKYSYPLVYDISVFIADFLYVNYNLSMTQNEITYIAFHICSSFSDFSDYKVSITYVYSDYWCYHKKTIDQLLNVVDDKAFIKQSVSISDYSPTLYHSDMIVSDSNVPLPEPYIYVPSLPIKDDLRGVIQLVDSIYQRKQYEFFHNNFLRFFSPNCFLFYNGTDYLEVIKTICSIALQNNYINEDFHKNILKREKLANTAFNLVAIPHTLSVYSKKTFIFVAICNPSLPWGNAGTNVKLVTLLGINKNDRKIFSRVYDFLVNILSDTKNINTLAESSDYNDFIKKLDDLARIYAED